MLFFIMILVIFCSVWFYFFHIARELLNKFNLSNKIILILGLLFGFIVCLGVMLGLMFESIIVPFILYLTVINLIFDGIYFMISKIIKKDIYKYHVYLYLIPFICTISLCIFGSYNITNLRPTYYNLKAEKLSKDIKIIFLSDTHYGKLFDKKQLDSLVNKLNKMKDIDMILLGGDIIEENTSKKQMEYIFNKLGNIKTTYGTFYVYGNHDKQTYTNNKSYSIEELKKALDKSGVTLLKDEAQIVSDEIAIIGREDYSYSRKGIKTLVTEDIKDKYLIMLDHQPQDYKSASSSGVDLILSGHTHGGQLFPIAIIIDLLKTSEMSYGYKKVNDLDAIVSSGVYGWGFPIRTEGKSEYVIITVKGTKSNLK